MINIKEMSDDELLDFFIKVVKEGDSRGLTPFTDLMTLEARQQETLDRVDRLEQQVATIKERLNRPKFGYGPD